MITLVVWSEERIHAAFDAVDLAKYSLLGTLVVALALVLGADALASRLIENWRGLRQVLSGSRYIEGDWVGVVFDPSDAEKIDRVEYLRIRYKGEEYQITGSTWTYPELKWRGEFETQAGKYDGRRYEYYYRDALRGLMGFGLIVFTPHDSTPTTFICRYIDEESKEAFFEKGKRVSMRFDRISQDARLKKAHSFAEELQDHPPVPGSGRSGPIEPE